MHADVHPALTVRQWQQQRNMTPYALKNRLTRLLSWQDACTRGMANPMKVADIASRWECHRYSWQVHSSLIMLHVLIPPTVISGKKILQRNRNVGASFFNSRWEALQALVKSMTCDRMLNWLLCGPALENCAFSVSSLNNIHVPLQHPRQYIHFGFECFPTWMIPKSNLQTSESALNENVGLMQTVTCWPFPYASTFVLDCNKKTAWIQSALYRNAWLSCSDNSWCTIEYHEGPRRIGGIAQSHTKHSSSTAKHAMRCVSDLEAG